MLNCNRRTPNERKEPETPSSIFTREAEGLQRLMGRTPAATCFEVCLDN